MSHRQLSAIALALALSACAAGPSVTSVPAPAGALECATAKAVSLGYTPVSDGVSFVSLVDSGTREEMVVTHAAGVLTVELKGAFARGTRFDPSGEAKTHAASIISDCGGA